jgi:hypothetical protein
MATAPGYNFSGVRIHTDGKAAASAQAVNALAYTVGHNIVFAPSQFSPWTYDGRKLIAHELVHVVQQSHGAGPHSTPRLAAGANVVQRAPADKTKAKDETQADYERKVKEGTWCRDSEKSGALHPGLQCYREIPSPDGYPEGGQICFNKQTGQYAESSPDYISAVSGQNKDGTCDIPLGITDPPHPFSQRGRRALGHLIGDIATEDPDVIGRHFFRFSGVAMGIALPKHGLDTPGLGTLVIPAILGFIAGELGAGGLPLLNGLTKKHGFLPTIGLGAGNRGSLSVSVGLEKRDRPLPLVPVNTYLTFNLDTSLGVSAGPSASSTFLAKVGVRVDPGKQGGLFALGSIGTGLAVGSDISRVKSTELGVGVRATDFLDVQAVHETVSSGGAESGTWWLTLRLVAPRRALKEHPKEE